MRRWTWRQLGRPWLRLLPGVRRALSRRAGAPRGHAGATLTPLSGDGAAERVFEALPAGAVLVGLDFRFLRVNSEFCRIMGSSSDELLRLHVDDVTSPETHASDAAQARRLLAGEIDRYERDASYVRKDGSILLSHVAVRVLRDAQGRPLCFLALLEDTTRRRRAEEEIRRLLAEMESQRRLFEKILELAPAGIVVFDGEELRVKWCNPEYRRLFGRDVTGLRIADYVPGSEQSGLDKVFREVMTTGRPHVDTAYPYVGLERGLTYWHWALMRLPREGGKYDFMLMAIDTTEQVRARQRAETAARQARARLDELQRVIDGMREGVAILGTHGEVLLLNQAAMRVHRFKEGEPQLPLRDLARLFAVDDLAGRALPVDEWPLARVARGETFRNVEVSMRRVDDGGAPWIVKCSGTPVLDEAGNAMLNVLTYEDVTEEKGVALERQRLLDRVNLQALELETIIDSSLVGLLQLTPEGTVVRMNPAARELFGVDAKEVPAPREHLAAKARVETLDGAPFRFEDLPGSRALRGEVVRGVALATYRTDGKRVCLSMSAAPIRCRERGHVIGAVVTFTDITRQQELEASLRQHVAALAEADKRKNDFLAMLGHELRNPLAAITLASHNLDETAPNGAAAPFRKVIARQTAHMTRLVDDLLDVARITRGRIELRRRPVDLAEVLQRAVESVSAYISERRHQLSASWPDGLVLLADPTRLEQVFSNLLQNAAKYTEPGGRIWLSVEPDDGEVTVKVKDTGVGISHEMLPRIFEPFTQASQSLARSQGGLGLGLTVARTVVELHGGSVQVLSGGVGRGSEFVVRLPLHQVATEAKREASPPQAPVGVPHRVLIVEDNRDVAEALATTIGAWGHAVDVAHDGQTGVAAALAQKPDVVLVDIGLPDIDGYEVARRLRTRGSQQNGTRLVALTGYGGPEDRRRAEEAGFSLHLVKPVDLRRLQSVLAD